MAGSQIEEFASKGYREGHSMASRWDNDGKLASDDYGAGGEVKAGLQAQAEE